MLIKGKYIRCIIYSGQNEPYQMIYHGQKMKPITWYIISHSDQRRTNRMTYQGDQGKPLYDQGDQLHLVHHGDQMKPCIISSWSNEKIVYLGDLPNDFHG